MDEGREEKDEEFHEDEESSKLEYDAALQQLKRIKDEVISLNPELNVSPNTADIISNTSVTQDTDKITAINTIIGTTSVKGKTPDKLCLMNSSPKLQSLPIPVTETISTVTSMASKLSTITISVGKIPTIVGAPLNTTGTEIVQKVTKPLHSLMPVLHASLSTKQVMPLETTTTTGNVIPLAKLTVATSSTPSTPSSSPTIIINESKDSFDNNTTHPIEKSESTLPGFSYTSQGSLLVLKGISAKPAQFRPYQNTIKSKSNPITDVTSPASTTLPLYVLGKMVRPMKPAVATNIDFTPDIPKLPLYPSFKQIPKDTVIKHIPKEASTSMKLLNVNNNKEVQPTVATTSVIAGGQSISITPVSNTEPQKSSAMSHSNVVNFISKKKDLTIKQTIVPSTTTTASTSLFSSIVTTPTTFSTAQAILGSTSLSESSKKLILSNFPIKNSDGLIKSSTPPPLPVTTITPATVSSKPINFQISNGKITDPLCPIKLLTINKYDESNNGSKNKMEQVLSLQNGNLSSKSSAIQLLKPVTFKEAKKTNTLQISNGNSLSNADKKNEYIKSLSNSFLKAYGPASTILSDRPKSPPPSILCNKLLDHLQKSPRLMSRSKSLTSAQFVLKQKLGRRTRRPSAPSFLAQKNTFKMVDNTAEKQIKIMEDVNNVKLETDAYIVPLKHTTTRSNLAQKINIEQSNVSSICDSLFDSLECDEELNVSEKSKSVTPNSNLAPFTIVIDPTEPLTLSTNQKPDNCIKSVDDPFQCIKWRAGIGYMCYSDLHFKTNEFNLIETLDHNDFTHDQIDNTFAKRINKHVKRIINSKYPIIETMFNCVVCKRPSATETCSKRCTRKYQSVTQQSIKNDPSNVTAEDVPAMLSSMAKCSLLKKKKPAELLSSAEISMLPSQPCQVQSQPAQFTWEQYLKNADGPAAPTNLFINPFPCSANNFEVGMKVEAIDPEHCSMFCVCTIVERIGYRIKLHFDGCNPKFDFWKNADSMDIFPPGWCSKTNRVLHPPPLYGDNKFEWSTYLVKTQSLAAPRQLFTHLNSSATADNPFRVGWKLEADDLKHSRKVCVATIGDVLDNRILIRFDGWNDTYDYWTDITSPYVHPINWHKQHGFHITTPPEITTNFSWENYLAMTKSKAVPENLFVPRAPLGFMCSMKLEIVDKKNPTLIRPASVVQVDDYEVKVLFDGWPTTYAYWIDDDNDDIHPVNWCQKTGHPLEPPPEYIDNSSICGVIGCRGIGNAKFPDLLTHTYLTDCPYESKNWTHCHSYRTKRLICSEVPTRRSKYAINRIKRLHNQSLGNSAPIPVAAPVEQQQQQVKRVKVEDTNVKAKSPLVERCLTPPVEEIVIKEEKIDEVQIEENMLDVHDPTGDADTIETRLKLSNNFLEDYGPSRQYIHKMWLENSKSIRLVANDNFSSANPLNWSVDEVADYVSKLPNCSRLGNVFREQQINGPAFLALTQNDLVKHLKLRLGPSVKIINSVMWLREETNETYFVD